MLVEIADIVRPVQQRARWSLPIIGPHVIPASLTNLLPSIPDVERALLPNSRRAITDINRALVARPLIAPSATTVASRTHGRVGLAVDRAALFLAGHDLTAGPANWLGRTGKTGKLFSKLLRTWKPSPRGLFHNRAAIGWLYALGGLDSVRRGFAPLMDVVTRSLPRHVNATTSRDWFATLLSPDVHDEIVALLRSLKEIRIRGTLSLNPVFGGIGPIRGSDGDWIVGETLVELKCVVGGPRRRDIAQLICYHALSQLEQNRARLPSFSRLALCLPRQSTTITGTANEWLYAFGAPRSEIVVPALHECFESYDRAILAPPKH